jgi:hypothetical protein
MHGGRQLFSPTLLVEVERSYLNSGLLSMHLQKSRGEETYVRALVSLGGWGGAW